MITTLVGSGTATYSGDNGDATSAEVNYPTGIAVDTSGFFFISFIVMSHLLLPSPSNTGNVYIGDTNNNRIRKVTASTGIITTAAGTGVYGSTVDNTQATSQRLRNPRGVATDSSGPFISSYYYFIIVTFFLL